MLETTQRIRLADGGEWEFDGPAEVAGRGAQEVAVVRALVQAIAESEDAAERRRGELALAIRLLSRRYRLTPDDYSRLLTFSPDDPRGTKAQDAFRVLARLHAETLRPAVAAPAAPSRGFFFPLFRLRRRRSVWAGR